MTRAEHMTWAKSRALEILETGDREQAITSMLSDLGKHEETARCLEFAGALGLFEIMNGDLISARKFITGLAE